MHELKIGQEVDLEFGGKAKVAGIIGKGDQSAVYLVEYNGMQWALKWYNIDKIENPDAFRNNLKQNITDGAPSNRFLWPKYLTKVLSDGSFGYLMELKPDSFDSFVDILNTYKLVTDPSTGRTVKKTVRFSTLYAMVTAVINIVNAFRQLHRSGKSYQYLSDGGFFINIDTGAILVCDCDNIVPEGSDFGINGKPGYIAPEVVKGTAKPDVQTDKYSLAVVLFKLLFRGDPLEGEKVIKDVCLTKESELKHYGQEALFIYDPNDDSNRPVRGIHDNVMKFWKVYPDYVKEAFIRSFTEGLNDINKRMVENEWQELFIRLRAEIIMCGCGRTNFISMFEMPDKKTYKCPKCGMKFATIGFSNNSDRIPLYLGKKFFECEIYSDCEDFLNLAGELVENKITGKLGIKNCSEKSWKVKMPDGIYHEVAPGKGCPIWKELEIDFGEVTAKI
ncbi:MAG: protein kinase [Ruminococcus sp.]|nr:protein kinase [Ruminococcus sp.]